MIKESDKMTKESDKMTLKKSTTLIQGGADCVVIVVALATYRSTIGAYRRRLRRIVPFRDLYRDLLRRRGCDG